LSRVSGDTSRRSATAISYAGTSASTCWRPSGRMVIRSMSCRAITLRSASVSRVGSSPSRSSSK
jgi:hypothetical protein